MISDMLIVIVIITMDKAVQNLEYVVGMAMKIHENCNVKYMCNINIGKGLVVINTGWQAKMT